MENLIKDIQNVFSVFSVFSERYLRLDLRIYSKNVTLLAVYALTDNNIAQMKKVFGQQLAQIRYRQQVMQTEDLNVRRNLNEIIGKFDEIAVSNWDKLINTYK